MTTDGNVDAPEDAEDAEDAYHAALNEEIMRAWRRVQGGHHYDAAVAFSRAAAHCRNYAERGTQCVKLWHDDIRRPPSSEWTWARTNDEAKRVLLEGSVVEISLDHDLGCHEMDPDAPMAMMLRGAAPETGYDLAVWMCEVGIVPECITIHSWNPVGARRMAAVLMDAGATPVVSPFQNPRL